MLLIYGDAAQCDAMTPEQGDAMTLEQGDAMTPEQATAHDAAHAQFAQAVAGKVVVSVPAPVHRHPTSWVCSAGTSGGPPPSPPARWANQPCQEA